MEQPMVIGLRKTERFKTKKVYMYTNIEFVFHTKLRSVKESLTVFGFLKNYY